MRILLPESLEEALAALADADEPLVPIAGGTDLLVHWPQRPEDRDRAYLDLSGLEELRPLEWRDDELVLGGLTTYWDVITDERATRELPLLAAAGRQVGAIQIQSRGTWAGNVVNASPAADGVPVLMAYDASLVLASRDGTEEVPLAEFYRGYKDLRMRPDQLIRSIRIPRRAHDVEVFEKVGSRRAQAITKVGFAAARSADGWRVAANSVAPFVCRCPTVEELLEGARPVGGPGDLLEALRSDVAPIDDIRSTAAYRERVLARILFHALRPHCSSFE
ncbi:MAG: FAD binding domain-containing protein [Gemmatimonadota bacterium]